METTVLFGHISHAVTNDIITDYSYYVFLRYNISQPHLEIQLMTGTPRVFQTSVICPVYLSAVFSHAYRKSCDLRKTQPNTNKYVTE